MATEPSLGPEGSSRTRGKEAQKHNILAARALAETVRTTLGPKGMDKMVVGSNGEVTVTNDGVTILEAMEISHPTARMIVEAARTQDTEVGDGTTTVVVLSGELLHRAEELLEAGIHPTTIIRGYKMAFEEAMRVLDKISKGFTTKQKALRDIALTAMTGKGVEEAKEKLAELAVGAAMKIQSQDKLSKENIKIIAKPGAAMGSSELIDGIIIEKERLKEGMPPLVKDARIALIDSPIEVKETEIDSKITINTPEQMESFIAMEDSMLKRMADRITGAGANVVFCQKGIDDVAQHYLEKAGLYVCRRVTQADMRLIARATGARIITELGQLTSADLGAAGEVFEKRIADEPVTFVRGCPRARAVTLLLRGGTEHVLDEVKRALVDAIGDMAAVLETGKLVGGAGAPEIELARALNKFADSVEGREQLAVKSFAKAMEIIPVTLAENSGLDPIEAIVRLNRAHDSGQTYAGLDVTNGHVVDTLKAGIVEPLKVKTQALSSALEVTTMILRIDDIIVNESKQPQNQPNLE